MGIVKAIGLDPNDEENKEEGLLCDIWGKEVFLSREDILEFDFTAGYSITTHKSQGGQAKVVIAPVITNHYIMLTRNILYTAMTRAEEMLVLVGQKKAVAMAIANTTPNLRRTFLSERIRKLVEDKKNGAANMELFG
jgi:exodeoxyribonuclease V alpha subunit